MRKVFHTKDKCSRRPSSNLSVCLAFSLHVCGCVCGLYYDIWSMGTRERTYATHRARLVGHFCLPIVKVCMQYSSIKCISFICYIFLVSICTSVDFTQFSYCPSHQPPPTFGSVHNLRKQYFKALFYLWFGASGLQTNCHRSSVSVSDIH